jgi:quinolinate synthase
VKHVIPEIEWLTHEPYIAAIEELKKTRNAIILAHNYQTPEIFYGVADLCGDSLALARLAAQTEADVIVMCGVHFMAETAKLMNPNKTVLIPSLEAGCSLAASIQAEDVRMLRQRYPGLPVVTYVNTSAAVKAECDVCCTSSNAVDIVNALDSDSVIFLPDEYLGKYVATQTDKKIILWQGHCEVHERFTAQDLINHRQIHQDLTIIAHPECPPDVLNEADFVGSTSQLLMYVKREQPKRVMMVTECSMSDNVAVEFPHIEFIRPCNLCPHMKKITLPNILQSLQEMIHPVTIPNDIANKAKIAVERMLELS